MLGITNKKPRINFLSSKLPKKKAVKKGASLFTQKRWAGMPKRQKMFNRAIFADSDRDKVPDIFDCQPFNRKKKGWAHEYGFSSTSAKRIKTVKMKPEKFLKETYREAQERDPDYKESYEDYKSYFKKNRSSIKPIKEKIKSKKESVPIGFLEYREGKPAGHEGRHTAIAAEELGIEEIPVTVDSYYHEKEPETSKLPRHRKQYPLPHWKHKGESQEEYEAKAPNRRAQALQENKEEKPDVLQALDLEDGKEVEDKV